MLFDEVAAAFDGVPFISQANARYLYDLIVTEDVDQVLELGIAHGTATCFIAAALQELGRGKVTSVDLIGAIDQFDPSAEEQLRNLDLQNFVEIVRMQSGYNWFLRDEIRKHTDNDECSPKYDLCIIDGPKNWTIDGAAFFLVDKLLKNNGIIIFDDYNWTYGAANLKREQTDGITHRLLSDDELTTPHIKEIFELLVKQHVDYGVLEVFPDRDWAVARKNLQSDKSYTVISEEKTSDVLARIIRKLIRMFS